MTSPRRLGLIVLISAVSTAGSAVAQMTLAPAQKAVASAVRDACEADYRRLCSGVRPGGGRILQCLEAHEAELTQACRAALPQARQLRATVPDPSTK